MGMARKFESKLELWNGRRLGILADAFEVQVREAVNGDYYLSFIYPQLPDDAERYSEIIEDHEVAFPQETERGQRFVIKKVEEIRQGLKIYKAVEAHHVAFGLNQYFYDGYIEFVAAQSLENMLGLLAQDTPYSFVVEGDFPLQDIFEWGEGRKLDLLHELRELYGAELSFDNYQITLTTRKGGNYGARVRYKHNMKGIRKISHSMERITRLYGYGKNGLTIEGYAGRTIKYIDSVYFDPNNPYMAKIEFSEAESQSKLLELMQQHLTKYELPNISYATEFLEMEKVDREFEPERIREAGDTVTVYDEGLGYSFDARVNSYDRYPFEPKRGSAVLTNFRQLKTSDYIFQATVGSKKAISYTSRNAVLKGVKYDDSLTLVDGLGMKITDDHDRERVRLGQYAPGQYGLWLDGGSVVISGGLPDSQVSGSSSWNGKTTLITDSGVYTGQVTTDQVTAGKAKIGYALIDSIKANQIDVSGGRITAGQIDGTSLQVQAANITGILQAYQINSQNLQVKAVNITGVLNANQINTIGLAAEKIFQREFPNNYAVVGGNYGDLSLYHGGTEYFRLENTGPDSFRFINRGVPFLGHTAAIGASAMGAWHFGNATVSGLNIPAKFS
jgi:phage minor structural protein